MVKKVEAFWNKHATFGTLLGRGAGEGGSDNRRQGGRGGQGVLTPLKSMQFGVLVWIHECVEVCITTATAKYIKITCVFFSKTIWTIT